jgi:diadenosine tetraphosphatase ApaH/serine/threonine PP2A family protein phosphatase
MRVLVVSDIHSNLAALEAVLADAAPFDTIWSLGDVVGYGPQPNECIERLQACGAVAVPGNHDWGVLGRLDLEQFNADARIANFWNRQRLTAASRCYLEELPEMRVEAGVTLVHGSPRYPIWEYLVHAHTARACLPYFDTPLCLAGHTHVPIIFRNRSGTAGCEIVSPDDGLPLPLPGERYIVNPGSVGQPRDGDPRAAYLLLDTDSGVFVHRRVPYDIAATQA